MALMMKAPAGLIMQIVDENLRVLVTSDTEGNPYVAGHEDPWRESGLYCERVILQDTELLVSDALADETWRHNPDVKLKMISYLGLPIRWPDLQPFGTICVLDSKPTVYSELDRKLIEQLRDLIEGHLALIDQDAKRGEEQALLASLTDNLPNGAVYRTIETAEGQVTYPYASAGFLQLVGVTAAEIMSSPTALWETIHEEDWPRMQEAGKLAKATGSVLDFEFRCRTRDGRLVWLRCRSAPRPGPQGSTLWDGVVVDVTAEKQEQEQDRLLKLAYENLKRAEKLAKIGSWSWNVGADRFHWSDMLYEMNRWDPKTPAPGFEGLRQVTTPETYDRLSATVAKCLQDGEPYSVDCESVRLNGEHFFTHVRGEAVRDETGKIIRLVGTLQDMTERRQQEEALRQSEARWQFAVESTGGGLWDWDVLSGNIFFSPQWTKMLGYQEGDVAPSLHVWAELVHPEDRQVCQESIRRYQTALGPVHCEAYRLRAKDGSWRWIQSSGLVVERTDDVTPRRIIGIHADITQRKEAQRALRDSEARWQFALDGAGDGVWDWDIKADRAFFSHQWKAMLGYDEHEIGPSLSEWSSRVHPQDWPQCWEELQRHIRGEVPVFVREFRMQARDGSWHWILDRAKIVERAEDGTPVRLIGTHTDLTGLKAVERALRASNERFDLVVRGSRNGIWDHNMASEELYWSGRFKELLGLDHRVTPNFHLLRSLIHPEDFERVKVAIEAHLDRRVPYREEYRLRHSDGHYIWVESTGQALWDPHGKAIRMAGSVTDITERKEAEERNRVLSERLHLAVKAGHVGIWEANMLTGQFLYTEEMDAIYGIGQGSFRDAVPANTFGGQFSDWFAVVHPEDHASVIQALERARCENIRVEYEHRIFRPSGEIRYVRSSAQMVRDENNVPVRGLGTTLDVTEHRLLTNALSLEKERLVLATQVGGIGIWEMDFKDGLFTWDAQMHAHYGLQPGEFRGSLDHWVSLIHPEDAPRTVKDWELSVACSSKYDGEFRVIRPTGEVHHIRALAQVIAGPNGEPTRAVGSNWDVTAQHHLTEALRVEKERLAMAIKAGGVGIWEFDFGRGEYLWDARMHEIYSHGPRHFRSDVAPGAYGGTYEGFLELLHPDDVENINEQSRQAVEGSSSIECEFRIRGADGGWRHLRSLGHIARHSNGALDRIAGINWDVTEERRAAATLQKAKDAADRARAAKGEFLAMMSHEIRTPMNTVLGMVRLTQKTFLTPKQKNYLDKMELSAKALLNIIDDILDYSKIEAGKLHVEAAEFRVEALIEAVANITVMKAEEKGLKLTFVVAPEVPDRLVGDALRLGQVLINLVNNAVKFTAKGEVSVSLALSPESSGLGLLLRFAVRDTGIGLDSSQITELFQAFAQADTYTTRKFGGTGLGLAICKRLVEMMGGRIWAESAKGQGSTFYFTVMVQASSGLPEPDVVDEPLRKGSLAGRRILVVDDNELNREVVTDFLLSMGMKVGTAAHGGEVLEKLENQSYDAVLMDVQMAPMTGLDATREIRQQSRWAHLPIIALTAHAQLSDREQSLAAGMNAHLTKPIDEGLLFETLSRFLPGDAGAQESPPEAATTESPLPHSLPGLDLLIAKERLGGKNSRVLRVQRSFLRGFSTAPGELERDLQQGNFEAVAVTAHRIKSAAAYLGATPLSDSAASVEEAIRSGALTVVSGLVEHLCRRLDEVLQGLHHHLAQVPNAIGAAKHIDPTATKALLKQAKAKVAAGDYAALTLLDEMHRLLVGTPLAARAERACMEFEDGELKAALDIVCQLEVEVESLTVEGTLP